MVQSESSLVFRATLEDVEFDQGMRRLRGNLRIMQSEADKTGSSFERIKSVTGGIASGLAKIGAAGVGALTGLAISSPAVAGEMARIRNSMRELSFAAGELLQPAFSAVADDIMPSLVASLKDGDSTISRFLSNLTTGLKELSSANSQVQEAQSALEAGTGTEEDLEVARRKRTGTFLGGGLGAAGFGTIAALLGSGPVGVGIAGLIGAGLVANSVNTPYENTQDIPGTTFPALGHLLERMISRLTDKDIQLVMPQGYTGGGSMI